MAPARKRALVSRRRRVDDEGEDDVSVATEQADDSQSEISVPSDIDEDADADNSDLSDVDSSASLSRARTKGKANGARKVGPANDTNNRHAPSPPIARSDTKFTAVKDTEVMMNGLKISDKAADDEAMDFESAGPVIAETPQPGPPIRNKTETFTERRRREHEEYKKKRDSDPAFIPNRGAFFMHDQRSVPGQNGFRGGYGRGRGRGRGFIGGPFSPASLMTQSNEPTNAPWQHDLHQTLIEPPPPVPSQQPPQQQTGHQPTSAPAQPIPNAQPQQQFAKPLLPAQKTAPVRSFSTTVHTHNAIVRVYLPGMKAPILFQGVPIKSHTRLPNHRPPLRRDKPVRISLPDHPPRYIFPTVERSFIFIPRALRPNQQGFGRGRGRPFGSYGGFSSRRTSAYGGSVYSPSVAMSRRSSLAREMGRDGLVSPAGSIMSRVGGGPVDANRPVVRLPPGTQPPSVPSVTSPTSVTNMAQQPYPLPQKPTFRENWQGQLPMHQPRPQKAVSVAGIESPASMSFHPPQQQEQQPFHQQVPAHMNGNSTSAEQPPFYPHVRQLSYPSQASTGTPLSNIPERAIHAPAFQPYQQPQPGFPPQQQYPVQPSYYYPAPQAVAPAPGGMVPMFVPQAQQPGYMVPMPAPVSTAPAASAGAPPPTMMAYESNGMTYYYDPSQLYAPPPAAPAMEGYAPQQSYAVTGMGGMMTPSPDGYYYPQVPAGTVFYQAQ